ncbi:hypothetical protein HMPREF0058_2006 [Actinomyces urogenitalis DSM 15434]|uniref:Integrase catalytic domain-containing protein n=1 Tax=Actinomyces urogenitalis DSM 15434 TaxID=525246 RepID=C0W812_9ACTO|nr:hypothetical protein HMPREF0058_2006 [Actinomyces urogenitalis DSM 15434]
MRHTLTEGWAFTKPYPSQADHLAALPDWIYFHKHHRPHTSIGKQPLITKLNKLPEYHT